MMENLELDLKLTVAHVNAILKHLANGVYAEVADVINLLHGQSVPQVQAASTTITEPANAPEEPAAAEEPSAPTEYTFCKSVRE